MTNESELDLKAREATVVPILGIFVGALAAIARGWIWSKGVIDGQVVGYAMGSLLAQFGIAYLFAGRQKVRNRNKFVLIFLFLGIFFLLLEMHSRTIHP